jgi:hypothetical protein
VDLAVGEVNLVIAFVIYSLLFQSSIARELGAIVGRFESSNVGDVMVMICGERLGGRGRAVGIATRVFHVDVTGLSLAMAAIIVEVARSR